MELRKKSGQPVLDHKAYVRSILDTPAAEKKSFTTGVGSKSKACLKFFSTSGCPYGEACHFSHYIPGGLSSLALSQTAPQILAVSSHKGVTVPSRIPSALVPQSQQKFSSDGPKAQLCKNYGTLQGCRFADKCHFEHVEKKRKPDAHMLAGMVVDKPKQFVPALKLLTPQQEVDVHKILHKEMDIARPNILMGAASVKLEERFPWSSLRDPTPLGLGSAAAAFGAMSTAKVSIAASLTGFIIGKGGVNAKAISRATGVKLVVKDHESDSNLKNIEMEGSFDQIQQASLMVKELLSYFDAVPAARPVSVAPPHYKTKLCDNYFKGSCTFGARCHFAHGPDDLHASI